MTKLIIGVVVFAVVILAGMMFIVPSTNSTANTTEISETNSYTIEGEVSKPGTYVIADAVSMSDLINAAGGPVHNTDDRSYFDEVVLKPGSTYYIGGKYDASDVCSTTAIDKVNINKDSAETLTKINGITSSIASSIVSYRAEAGTYTTLEDLLNVYGIGNATYRKIRNYVILHE